jgi:putative hydrolase of the HAD superfamily
MRAIIFDVDGVIFNAADADGCYQWRKNIEADLGITPKHISKIYASEWDKVTRGKLDIRLHLETVFKVHPELSITPDDYLTYWRANDVYINEPILTYVQSIKAPLYLATNQDPLRTSHISQMVGHHFEGIFSSCDIGFIKPEPGFYQHVELALNLHPDQIILIDDSRENIEAAQARGWIAHYYQGDIQALDGFLKASAI